MIAQMPSRLILSDMRRRIVFPLFTLCGFLWCGFHAIGLESSGNIRDIEPGKTVAGEVEVRAGYVNYVTFRFRVPQTVYAARISISGAPADLDLYLNHGRDMQDYAYVDAAGVSEAYNESLFFTRMGDPALLTGEYYLDVVYQKGVYPVVSGRALRSIPFFVTLEYIHAEDPVGLVPGEPLTIVLKPQTGMFSLLALDVPRSASVVRLDIFDTAGDVDMMVGWNRPALSREDADYLAESYLGSESLIIEREAVGAPRRLYVSVTDQLSDREVVTASLLATFSRRVPERLTDYPRLPRLVRDMDLALAAVWEIIGEAGKGSGCVVSPDGLILTSLHVVEDHGGDISTGLYGAMSLDHEQPPQELFRLKPVAVDLDRDLALLQVVSGLYGQPLPAGYAFPFLRIGDSERVVIGETLTFVGFPGIGGVGSRPTISLTRGVVSGFFRTGFGRYIKTDATISHGSSGGAALDREWRLVGLPVLTIGPEENTITYVVPVSALPKEWIDRIGEKPAR